MTKPTAVYLQLATLRRLAPHLTNLVGLDSLINRLADAAGYGAADAYPATTTQDAQALCVQNHTYDARYDLNGDLTVNTGDQALAAALGMPQSAPVTPPPSDTLTIILNDMTAPHEGVICGVAGYDWEHAAKIQRAQSGGITAMTGWGVAQHSCGGPQGYTGRVHVRNRQTWLWNGTAYTKVQSGAITWHDTYNTQTSASASGDSQWRDEGNGEYSFVVPADRSVHWAGPNNNIPNANYWIICTAEYKLVGGDIPNANVIADTGADWRNPGPVGAVVGRYRKLTDQWQLVTATTFRPTVAPT